jgi:hypothetical protein
MDQAAAISVGVRKVGIVIGNVGRLEREKVEGRQDGSREELVKARRAQSHCEAETRQEPATSGCP